jgi:hypothetical protein
MSDSIAAYRAASEADDIDGVMATLAPDVEVVSPISGRMVFRGADDVRILFAAVYGSLAGLRWHEEIGDAGRRVIVGEARIAGVRLTDAMVFDLTGDGRIRRIRPHLRPWLALTLLALRLLPRMARHPGVLLRALRAG